MKKYVTLEDIVRVFVVGCMVNGEHLFIHRNMEGIVWLLQVEELI